MLGGEVSARTSSGTLVDRIRDAVCAFGCAGPDGVDVRGAGRHVLLWRRGAPFARVTALVGEASSRGGWWSAGSYGLSFCGGVDGKWEILLVDDLPSVVEHALVGEGVLDPAVEDMIAAV